MIPLGVIAASRRLPQAGGADVDLTYASALPSAQIVPGPAMGDMLDTSLIAGQYALIIVRTRWNGATDPKYLESPTIQGQVPHSVAALASSREFAWTVYTSPEPVGAATELRFQVSRNARSQAVLAVGTGSRLLTPSIVAQASASPATMSHPSQWLWLLAVGTDWDTTGAITAPPGVTKLATGHGAGYTWGLLAGSGEATVTYNNYGEPFSALLALT